MALLKIHSSFSGDILPVNFSLKENFASFFISKFYLLKSFSQGAAAAAARRLAHPAPRFPPPSFHCFPLRFSCTVFFSRHPGAPFSFAFAPPLRVGGAQEKKIARRVLQRLPSKWTSNFPQTL